MFDKKYLERYAMVILNIPYIETFRDSLPSSMLDGYTETMEKILFAIEREKEGYNELISQTKDPKDIDFIKKEVDLLAKKEAIVRSALENSFGEPQEQSIQPESPTKKHLIFLKSPAGNVFLKGDIKDFPEEYLPDFLELINELREYDTKFDIARHKKFSSDARFANMFEFKRFKSRLVYRHLDKDTVLVVMGLYKNQTNPSKNTEALDVRLKQCQKNIFGLIEDLKDPEKKVEIILENEKIESDLIEQINSMSRGQKI